MIAGIVGGMLFGRVFGGLVGRFGTVPDLYYASFGIQVGCSTLSVD